MEKKKVLENLVFSFHRLLNYIIEKVQANKLIYSIYLRFGEILVNNIFIYINKNCPLIKFMCINILLNSDPVI